MNVLSKDEQIIILHNRLAAANIRIATTEQRALQLETQLTNIQTKVLPGMKAKLAQALPPDQDTTTFPITAIDKKNCIELLAGACALLDNICGDLRAPGCEPRTDMGKVREFLETVSGTVGVFERVRDRVAHFKRERYGMRDIFKQVE